MSRSSLRSHSSYRVFSDKFTNQPELFQPSSKGPLSLTVGNFDGFHRGHQALLGASVRWAQQKKGQSWVLSFDPHPTQFLKDPHFSLLFDRKDQWERARNGGAEGLLLGDFDEDFSKLSAIDFLNIFIKQQLQPKHLVVGYNFGFGHRREGNLALLQDWASQEGIAVEVVPGLSWKGQSLSSSAIRSSLARGEVQTARDFLGRPFYLRGEVIQGFQRGRLISFPTANLKPTVSFVPQAGVYVTQVRLTNDSQIRRSVTNIGMNPTVSGDGRIKIETHILDFNADIYGKNIAVEFLEFIRAEKKFSNLDELKNQIGEDAHFAQSWKDLNS